MSKLAQKRSVSRSTISRAVNEDLDMKLYVSRVRNLLTYHIQNNYIKLTKLDYNINDVNLELY